MSASESAGPKDYRPPAPAEVPAEAPRASEGPTSHRYDDTPVTRSWSDVLTGGILAGTGLVVLGDVAVASVVSVQFLGWTLVIGGAIAIGVSLWLAGRSSFWIGMLGGVLALVVGVIMIRHPEGTLLALSAAIGAVLLISGITRLAAAVQHPDARAALLFSGLLSLALGLLIFTQWPTSAVWLIGTLLGVQLLLDGVTMIIVGRPWLSRA
jgi:uncharacterized membrane protein HdeD (DUF308 family)